MFELLAALFVLALVGTVFFVAFAILKFAFKFVVGIVLLTIGVACFGVMLAVVVPLLILAALIAVPVALVSVIA